MKFININDVRVNLDTVTAYCKCSGDTDFSPYGIMIVFIGKKISDKYYFSHKEEQDKLLKQLDSAVMIKNAKTDEQFMDNNFETSDCTKKLAPHLLESLCKGYINAKNAYGEKVTIDKLNIEIRYIPQPLN